MLDHRLRCDATQRIRPRSGLTKLRVNVLGRPDTVMLNALTIETTVDGGSSNDSIDGSKVSAVALALPGGEGNDLLIGGDRNDRLEGGAGNDMCVAAPVTIRCWEEGGFVAKAVEAGKPQAPAHQNKCA